MPLILFLELWKIWRSWIMEGKKRGELPSSIPGGQPLQSSRVVLKSPKWSRMVLAWITFIIESDKEPNNWESYFLGQCLLGNPFLAPTNTISILSTRISRISIIKTCLREEIYKMINWWLIELQASGSTLLSTLKDLEWRSLPSDRDTAWRKRRTKNEPRLAVPSCHGRRWR